MAQLVPSRQRAQGFVRSCERYNAKERHDEADWATDVPPPEDDAQVVRVPGEEHLRAASASGTSKEGSWRTFILHRSPMSIPLWSICAE